VVHRDSTAQGTPPSLDGRPVVMSHWPAEGLTMTEQKYIVKCPHSDCQKNIKFSDNVPAGEHDCLCRHCKIRLSWSTYLSGERKPALTLVEKKKD